MGTGKWDGEGFIGCCILMSVGIFFMVVFIVALRFALTVQL